MTNITSASNPNIKYVRGLLQKKNRKRENAYIIEGVKSVRDALEAGIKLKSIYTVNPDAVPAGSEVPVYITTPEIFVKLSDTVNPQGILAVAQMCKNTFTAKVNGAYVYCDRVRDPGNLGTLIRTADSAGFDGVLLSDECADLYSPKTVRSCMGALFHIPVYEGFTYDMLKSLKNDGFGIYAGALRDNTVDYRVPDYTRSAVIAVGNEANGISDELLSFCTPIKIPIAGKAESLNAAVAGAVMMYEVCSQRNPLRINTPEEEK